MERGAGACGTKQLTQLRDPQPYQEAIRTAIGGGLGLSGMVVLADWAGLPLEVVPFTTSIVLVMAAPDSGRAQPRNIIRGHGLSWLSGRVGGAGVGRDPARAGAGSAGRGGRLPARRRPGAPRGTWGCLSAAVSMAYLRLG